MRIQAIGMMDDYELKYTRIEYERTFLVSGDADWGSVIEPYFQRVNRIILTPDEARLFEGVGGYRLRKRRYYHRYHDDLFSIDVFEGELEGLVLCSIETDRLEELMEATAPEYAVCEVTEDEFFTGGNLCRITRAELLRKISKVGKGS